MRPARGSAGLEVHLASISRTGGTTSKGSKVYGCKHTLPHSHGSQTDRAVIWLCLQMNGAGFGAYSSGAPPLGILAESCTANE